MTPDPSSIRAAFRDTYGAAPEVIARAPGRVNLIGEHTDYNEGFVLPLAINRACYIAARRRVDCLLNAYTVNMRRRVTANLAQAGTPHADEWINYVLGVADQFQRAGHSVTGVDLVVASDIPMGCGLSSSAAMEMAAVMMFEALNGISLDGLEAARLGQRVENQYLGVSSGIMDPFVIRNAREGHALFLDCRTLEHEHVPLLLDSLVFVIANTGIERHLADSAYNARVQECRNAVNALNEARGRNGTHLRDFTLEDLDDARKQLTEEQWKRARHVISENERTRGARLSLMEGDVETLGVPMNASDASLDLDYDVSCPELRMMTSIARSIEGCYGSRLTGAGFGGCTINLVEASRVEEFTALLKKRYLRETSLIAEVVVTGASAGAGIVS